jgi:hypothetical protein
MLKLNILCTRFESHYKNSTYINNEKIYDSSGGAQEKKEGVEDLMNSIY